jgi:porphyrinogen peroxidase
VQAPLARSCSRGLVLTIEQGGESVVHDLLSDLSGLARTVAFRLAGGATVVDEVHGFKYFDERDLLGFVDGTENPSGRAAEAAVSVGAEDSAFTGGSYLVVQKYLHDMAAWNALTVEDQERVIGRSKLSNVEMG